MLFEKNKNNLKEAGVGQFKTITLKFCYSCFSRSAGWQHRHPVHSESRGTWQNSQTLDEAIRDIDATAFPGNEEIQSENKKMKNISRFGKIKPFAICKIEKSFFSETVLGRHTLWLPQTNFFVHNYLPRCCLDFNLTPLPLFSKTWNVDFVFLINSRFENLFHHSVENKME